MVVHLHLAALLMACYHHVHKFGNLITLEILEAKNVLVVVEVLHCVPCHWRAASSYKQCLECNQYYLLW